jgi:phage gp36-like protein
VLPLPTVPAVLTRITCDIARYRLWEDRASDEVRRRYDDAVKLLTHISSSAKPSHGWA